MVFDKAKWHFEGEFPSDLKFENAATHIGMFLTWLILNKMLSKDLSKDSRDFIEKIKSRENTGRDFLLKELDGALIDEDLNISGDSFTRYYYGEGEEYGAFISDYNSILCSQLSDLYRVDDTWSNYDKIEKIINKRFRDWKLNNF